MNRIILASVETLIRNLALYLTSSIVITIPLTNRIFPCIMSAPLLLFRLLLRSLEL